MIELKDIEVQIKGFSLKDVSLTVQTGSCHCLIGPTGCGKTTLLEAVLGLRKIKKGVVLLDGRDITNMPIHKRGFSYVPQDLAIFPHLTVEENILYGIAHGTVSDKQKRYKAGLEIAESFGIHHLLKRKAVHLSGGERQRIALARALAPGYKYLFLDEPLSALHEGLKYELWFLIKELQQRYGLTILLITHDIEEAFFLGDTISILIDGRIHQSGSKTDSLIPKSLDVAKFLGIRNLFEVEIIDTTADTYVLHCKELKTRLFVKRVNGHLKSDTNQRLVFGIRSEDVMILREDLMREDQDNLLKGTIQGIFHKGTSYALRVLIDDSDSQIEVELPDYAFRKLHISENHCVSLSLRSERAFLISDSQI